MRFRSLKILLIFTMSLLSLSIFADQNSLLAVYIKNSTHLTFYYRPTIVDNDAGIMGGPPVGTPLFPGASMNPYVTFVGSPAFQNGSFKATVTYSVPHKDGYIGCAFVVECVGAPIEGGGGNYCKTVNAWGYGIYNSDSITPNCSDFVIKNATGPGIRQGIVNINIKSW